MAFANSLSRLAAASKWASLLIESATAGPLNIFFIELLESTAVRPERLVMGWPTKPPKILRASSNVQAFRAGFAIIFTSSGIPKSSIF
ncbi:MAG: hypothetical protein LBB77_09335, partial [Treponema sp.]|nr:hypothetical protein [Treponema sp.]